MAMLGVGLLLMIGCQHLAYASVEWKEFLAFNAARTEVYDFTGIPSYVSILLKKPVFSRVFGSRKV